MQQTHTAAQRAEARDAYRAAEQAFSLAGEDESDPRYVKAMERVNASLIPLGVTP